MKFPVVTTPVVTLHVTTGHVNMPPMPAKKPVNRRYRGVSEEQRRAERRARLVEAGVRVYGGEGYHAATVKAVCAEAGLTERYFYESFANREALLLAAYAMVTGELRERIVAALLRAAPTPEAVTRAALAEFFTTIRDDPARARLLLIEVLGVSAAVDRAYHDALREFQGLVQAANQLVRPDAPDDGLDGELLAAALVGAVVQLAHHWVVSGHAKPLQAVIDTSYAIFIAVARRPAIG
jgi:AcrR family transcriptional regulator